MSFARKTLQVKLTTFGNPAILKVKPSNTIYCLGVEPTKVYKWKNLKEVYPMEFYIAANSKLNTFETGKEFLVDKAIDDLLLEEETRWKRLINKASKSNIIPKFDYEVFKKFSPRMSSIFIGMVAYKNMMENYKLKKLFKPTNNVEDIPNGYIGKLGKLKVFSDIGRNKPLLRNSVIFFKKPSEVGAITQRKELQSYLTKEGIFQEQI